MNRIPSPLTDAELAAAESLVQLFATSLEGVTFPDVDGRSLDANAARARTATQQLVDAEAALSAARDEAEEAHAELRERMERAVAYLAVYTSDDAELREKLEEVRKATGAKGPRRPRKRSATTTLANGDRVPGRSSAKATRKGADAGDTQPAEPEAAAAE